MVARVNIVEDAEAPVARNLPAKIASAQKYDPEQHPRVARFMASRGAMQHEIAEALGVSTRTLYNWMNAHPAFQEAVLSGNDAFNPRVERALAERALGFWVSWDEHWTTKQDGKTIHHHEIRKKYFPPDVTAQIFFLKNRMPDRYRDVQQHNIVTDQRTNEQIAADIRDKMLKLKDAGVTIDLEAEDITPKRKTKGNGKGNGHVG